MDNEGKFWICINFIAAFALVAIVFFITSYWKDHNKRIVELIGSGVDPIEVMCAMQDDFGTHPVCIVLAAKR